jgi:16S rRNA (uracil1498-N3)-methyltransferase
LHLAVAPTKMNDRYEWFLEKTTDWVHEITPIICERSERKVINKDRFDKIVLSMLRNNLMIVTNTIKRSCTLKFLKTQNDGLQLIAHCEGNR